MEESALSEVLLLMPNWEGAVNMLEGRATIQSEPGRLEKWADGNLMKLNEGEILRLEYNSPAQQYRLWDLLAEMTWRSRKKKTKHESALCPHSH